MSALETIRDQILTAAAGRRVLRIRGGGSKDFYGQSLEGELLETAEYSGIVSYEPTELVLTARCGTPLGEIDAALKECGQALPFDPPAFGTNATIGGVVASGLSGPRRQSVGAVRDYVLGAALMNSRAEVLYFGGQVMKNVAGYDVSRLLCGSMGTLGLITEVSLKVLPVPPADVTVGWRLKQAPALALMNEWGGQPLPVAATAWHGDDLGVRFCGAQAAVAAAVKLFEQRYKAVTLPADEAHSFWQRLREQQLAFFQGDAPLWRVSLPSTVAPLALAGPTVTTSSDSADVLIEWGGALRWLRYSGSASELRAYVAALGGTACLFRGGDKSVGVFHRLAAINARINHRLKQEFDPLGIFNPGRMYPPRMGADDVITDAPSPERA